MTTMLSKCCNAEVAISMHEYTCHACGHPCDLATDSSRPVDDFFAAEFSKQKTEGEGKGEEFKPCPFCGQKEIRTYRDEAAFINSCNAISVCKCGAQGANHMDILSAVEAWNTRPIEDALRADLAKAREDEVKSCSQREFYHMEALRLKDELTKAREELESVKGELKRRYPMITPPEMLALQAIIEKQAKALRKIAVLNDGDGAILYEGGCQRIAMEALADGKETKTP